MDDIWRNIWSKLSARDQLLCKQVSKQWMKRIRELCLARQTIDSEVLYRCGNSVTTFRFGIDRKFVCGFNPRTTLDPGVILKLFRHSPNLKKIELYGAFLPPSLFTLFDLMPQSLEVLRINSCVIDATESGTIRNALITVFRRCSGLKEFTIIVY
ncbi:unnamed protein product [Dracunculus medinensis]|uniref:F-box domain-containing protein n=1 Tax=Dracunculus medinensis TaxID=318479 RepID=A0A0N4UHW4_DRAME|nr:unnamed protein product [Dracunculus medinensis]